MISTLCLELADEFIDSKKMGNGVSCVLEVNACFSFIISSVVKINISQTDNNLSCSTVR